MDPNLISAPAQPALLVWIQTYGNVVLFIAQILYWAGLLVFAGYFVATYKRYTNFQMGLGSFAPGAGEKKDSETKSEKVSVEEFVE